MELVLKSPDDRAVNPQDIQRFYEFLNRAGLVQAMVGYMDVWEPALRGCSLEELREAYKFFLENGVPGGALFLRPHDVRKRVLSRRNAPPKHLACPDHPGHFLYACQPCKEAFVPADPERVRALLAEVKRAAEVKRVEVPADPDENFHRLTGGKFRETQNRPL